MVLPKQAAEHVVHRLLRVICVANQVTIKPTVDATKIDNDISFALNRSWFDPRSIHVSATGGKVTLTGTVDSWSDWEEAASVAWAAAGATSVENNIVIM
jgi:osmotically-inducible protein OsmY